MQKMFASNFSAEFNRSSESDIKLSKIFKTRRELKNKKINKKSSIRCVIFTGIYIHSSG